MSLLDYINENTVTINQEKLYISNSSIKLDDNNKLEMFTLYRAHTLTRPALINNLIIPKNEKNIRYHLINGDFHFDLLNLGNWFRYHKSNI